MNKEEQLRIELAAIEASIETLKYSIKHLTRYVSFLQVREWKRRLRKLKNKKQYIKLKLKSL